MKKINPQLPKKNKFNKIALIGESPGKQEELAGKPFVGPSGEKILNPILRAAGIDRSECLVDNICRYRPPDDKLEIFEKKHPELIEEGVREMQALIEEYDPNVIVALGAKPLYYLTGVKDAISNYRGSVLPSIGFKKTYKVIPTFHPAYIIRNYEDSVISIFDMRRIQSESKFPDIKATQRTLIAQPTFEEVMEFFDLIERKKSAAYDIETQWNGHITCFSYATSSDYAMSIPIVCETGPFWSVSQEAEIWKRNSEILANPSIEKIIHNYMFEGFMMKYHYGMIINNVYDTLIASHVLWPELPHSLAFLTSIFTKEPYYKDEGKGDKRTREDWVRHYIYNSKDTATTFEISEGFKQKLPEEDLQHVFEEEMQNALYGTRMTLDGVNVDHEFMRAKTNEAIEKQEEARKKLVELVGYDINPGSPQQLIKLLYTELGLPKQYKKNAKGKIVLTTDADALNELGFKHDAPELNLILEYRRHQTNKSFFTYWVDDRDGKARFSNNPGAQEGARWSTSKTPGGLGRNFQNLPKPARGQVLAEDGFYLLEIDLEQVESRNVAYYANCVHQIEIFNSKQDIHAITAAYVFNMPIEEVSDKNCIERYLGKTLNHSSNYGVGGAKYVKKLYKDTLKFRDEPIKLSPREGQRLINGYHELYPEVKENFHKDIQDELRYKLENGQISRTLVNAFGRKRHFWGRLNDANTLFEAYNYKPQSNTAMIINKVINKTNENLYELDVRTLIHTHDGCLFQIPKDNYEWFVKEIYSYFNIPMTINGYVVTMPAEISIGERWGSLEEYKI